VYLATFGVLAPYRKLGLGSLMLEYLLKAVKEMSGVKRIDLHVSVDNEGAKEFYTKRGFEVVETVENYYKGKQDSRAYLLRFKISSE
jgi:ribosomal protein S18 acetylase RimI-like enzyme